MKRSPTTRSAIGRLMGGGRAQQSIAVPVMDGPLKPNERLKHATSLLMVESADNLTLWGQRVLLSSGHSVMEMTSEGDPSTHSEHQAAIACLAASDGGALAVGLDNTGVKIVGGPYDGLLIDYIGNLGLNCPTSAVFIGEDTLIVTNGSTEFSASEWRYDLIHRGRSGSIARVDLSTGNAHVLAASLCFPTGLCLPNNEVDSVLVCEAWRHRIIRLDVNSPSMPHEVVAELPAYPGHLCQSTEGGYWLACFAPRSQFMEFILRERRYCRQMVAEIDPKFWIAPALTSGQSFKEPLQEGRVIRLGIHKPWAPTLSYGLVVRLDEDYLPCWSAHSRADGSRHGITSLVETKGRLLVTSKGKGELFAMEYTALAEPEDTDFGQEE